MPYYAKSAKGEISQTHTNNTTKKKQRGGKDGKIERTAARSQGTKRERDLFCPH